MRFTCVRHSALEKWDFCLCACKRVALKTTLKTMRVSRLRHRLVNVCLAKNPTFLYILLTESRQAQSRQAQSTQTENRQTESRQRADRDKDTINKDTSSIGIAEVRTRRRQERRIEQRVHTWPNRSWKRPGPQSSHTERPTVGAT